MDRPLILAAVLAVLAVLTLVSVPGCGADLEGTDQLCDRSCDCLISGGVLDESDRDDCAAECEIDSAADSAACLDCKLELSCSELNAGAASCSDVCG
jgi:hypothetical protein